MRTVDVASPLVSKIAVATPLPPRVLDYDDYHLFLRDFYVFKKAQTSSFSYRRFASLSGIKSSNFLMLVMKKERRLSADMAKAVSRAMKLPKLDADYFILLVRLELCSGEEERAKLEKDQRIALCKIAERTLPRDKADYLSAWYYPLIRELAFLPDFTLSSEWISKKLSGVVSDAQAGKAIEILLRLGLWSLDAHGKVKVTDVYVSTGSEDHGYGELKVVDVHKGNLRAWAEILSEIPSSERELALLNIPINAAKLPELKKRIQNFQDELIGWLQDEKEPTQLVQLGTYLVPLTKPLP